MTSERLVKINGEDVAYNFLLMEYLPKGLGDVLNEGKMPLP